MPGSTIRSPPSSPTPARWSSTSTGWATRCGSSTRRPRGRGVVVGGDLPVLDEGRVYELWILREDGPAPAGLFRPDADGAVEVVLDLDDVVGSGGLAVSDEPAGGSPSPTGPILAEGELPA